MGRQDGMDSWDQGPWRWDGWGHPRQSHPVPMGRRDGMVWHSPLLSSLHEGMWDSQNPMGLSVTILDITQVGGAWHYLGVGLVSAL